MQGVVGLDNFGIQGSVNLLATDIKGVAGMSTYGMQGSVNLLTTGIKGVVEMGTVGMQGSVGIICTPNTGIYIRFDKSLLSWLGADNKEGVTKYNVLIASDDWELKEVEELL